MSYDFVMPPTTDAGLDLPVMTHFDRALETTRKGFVAARDVANALENVGIHAKLGQGPATKRQLRVAQDRLLDLRILVSDLEAHLRLSDAAEEDAIGKKKKDNAGQL